jgi:selenocysteine lyase/cysteine desulfurase
MPGPPEPLIGPQRDAFNVPGEIAYFNTASLAPQLRVVREAGEAALERRGQPWLITSSDWFSDVERLRLLFAQLIGASADGVAIVPATSYGFAVAARNLPLQAGQRVLVLAEEYPSGVYTWRAASRRCGAELLTVTREPGASWSDAVLAALNERVAIVSVPNVHWTDGALVDLAAIAERTRELGAALVIDGSQSVGAMPTDVSALRPDFLVTVGYKWLLGPLSVGYLYVAERHRDGQPLEENWINRVGSEDFAALVDYRDGYQPGARRFDSGQRTKFELIPMAIAALEQILAWQVPRIGMSLRSITGSVAQRATALGLDAAPEHDRGPHMLGLGLPARARAGASTVLAQADCHAAFRGASLRISPHLHTTDEDVERLLDALARVAGSRGPVQP